MGSMTDIPKIFFHLSPFYWQTNVRNRYNLIRNRRKNTNFLQIFDFKLFKFWKKSPFNFLNFPPKSFFIVDFFRTNFRDALEDFSLFKTFECPALRRSGSQVRQPSIGPIPWLVQIFAAGSVSLSTIDDKSRLFDVSHSVAFIRQVSTRKLNRRMAIACSDRMFGPNPTDSKIECLFELNFSY